MMQRNENDLLPLWHKYHSALFGAENLVIIDNGSTDQSVIETLAKCQRSGSKVVFMPEAPLSEKGDIIGAIILSMEVTDIANFFLPLDCDEFVGVQVNDEILFDKVRIEAELNKFIDCEAPLAIKGSYYNDAGIGDRFFFWKEKKVFFRAKTFAWMDEGFHSGRSKAGLNPIETSLIHVHFQHKPLDTLRRHAKQKMREYIDIENELEIKNFQGPGNHVVRYYFMSDEEYKRTFDQTKMIRLESFEEALKAAGVRPPFELAYRFNETE